MITEEDDRCPVSQLRLDSLATKTPVSVRWETAMELVLLHRDGKHDAGERVVVPVERRQRQPELLPYGRCM